MSGGQLNPRKCHLVRSSIKVLGHVVSTNEIEPDHDKIKELVMPPSPTNTKQLHTFLQKVKYLSRFISMLSQVLFSLQ